jgi:hypothetical protein
VGFYLDAGHNELTAYDLSKDTLGKLGA